MAFEHLRETDLAYFAGIIDGEGSISIFSYTMVHKRYGAYSRYKPVLSISNTNPEMMKWIVDHFGGVAQPVKRARDKITKWKQCYHWAATHRRAATILHLVMPYLVAKRAQAELLLRYQTTATRKWNVAGTPPKIIRKRAEISAKITYLNRRGPI